GRAVGGGFADEATGRVVVVVADEARFAVGSEAVGGPLRLVGRRLQADVAGADFGLVPGGNVFALRQPVAQGLVVVAVEDAINGLFFDQPADRVVAEAVGGAVGVDLCALAGRRERISFLMKSIKNRRFTNIWHKNKLFHLIFGANSNTRSRI
ncbi:hypothetical protein, partial [Parachitinimonas caeni]